ncbi:MAG: tail fiber domain-containing protein [bacterium]
MRKFVAIIALIVIGAIYTSAMDAIRIAGISSTTSVRNVTLDLTIRFFDADDIEIWNCKVEDVYFDNQTAFSIVITPVVITYNPLYTIKVENTLNGIILFEGRLDKIVSDQSQYGKNIGPIEIDQTGNYTLNSIIVNSGDILLQEAEANGTNKITLKAPESLASDLDFILPSAAGSSGQVLSTDGAGNLSWATAGSGLYWSLTGNAGTDSTVNFIGTTDNNALVIKINNQRAGKISASSNTSLGYHTLNNPTITGVSNTAIGYNALDSNTTGNYNTANGWKALYFNTSGDNNTANGSAALYYNASGMNNTANGSGALYHNTTGSANTANGAVALLENTTGYGNTANGSFALYTNTTGYYNTANGSFALYSNTMGSYNTANGSWSLYYSTGNNNTASGYRALYSSKANSRSTAIGDSAMYFADNRTTGRNTYNTAVGHQALRGSTTAANNTGQYNTAIGDQALFYVTSGSENSALGYMAGRYIADGGTANETSYNSVYIGSSTKAGANGNTNEIVIGHNAKGAGSNTVQLGNTSITSCYIRGIHNQTSSGGIAVYVNSSGKLGTTTSSRRFKENINDMADASDVLMKLRPVTFVYKDEYADGDKSTQYGLIAEEVAQIAPNLVAFDKDGNPYTVYYNRVNAMLLNEVQKQKNEILAQKDMNEKLLKLIEDMQKRIDNLEGVVEK